MPCADVDWHPAGPVFPAGRQEYGLCAHDFSCLHLLLPLIDRDGVGQTGKDSSHAGRVGSEPVVLHGRIVAAISDVARHGTFSHAAAWRKGTQSFWPQKG